MDQSVPTVLITPDILRTENLPAGEPEAPDPLIARSLTRRGICSSQHRAVSAGKDRVQPASVKKRPPLTPKAGTAARGRRCHLCREKEEPTL